MRRSEQVLLLLVVAVLATLAGCASEPSETALPDGVAAVADQTRLQRQGREVFVRIVNDGTADLEVESLVLGSNRASDARTDRPERVRPGYEADVEVELPPGTCGDVPRFEATITYRVDGEERRSRIPVDDRYGALTRLLDADCVATTLADAGDLDVAEPVRDGDLLRLPVIFTPADSATSTLTLVGYRGTPLVRPAEGSATDVRLGPAVTRADLVIEPARCDAHAIAEDKVGRLIPVEVAGPGLPDGSTFTLPLSTAQKMDVTSFVRDVCGL